MTRFKQLSPDVATIQENNQNFIGTGFYFPCRPMVEF